MQNKKILIIAAILLVVAGGAVAGFLFLRKKEPNQLVTDVTVGNQSKVTGTGELGTLPPLRNTMPAITDQSQPFAPNLPRSTEPPKIEAPRTAEGQISDSSQTIMQKAIAQGLIPDKDGFYVQKVDSSGMNLFMASSFQSGLNNDQYLAKYHPEARQRVRDFQGGTGSDTIAQVDTSWAGSGNQSSASQSVPEVPGVDRRSFNIIAFNTRDAYVRYLNDMNAAISGFDIFHDQTLLLNIVSGSAPEQISEAKAKAEAAAQKVLTIPVNSNLLGFSQTVYDAYKKFAVFAEDILLMDIRDAAPTVSGSPGADATTRDLNNVILAIQRYRGSFDSVKRIMVSLGYLDTNE